MSDQPKQEETEALELGDDPLAAGLAAAFAADSTPPSCVGHSVLLSLAKSLTGAPRVMLRDPNEDATPVVRTQSAAMAEIPRQGERYQLLGEMARGGMGAILKGRDMDLGRDLAVKVLLEGHAGNPAIVRRFVEEAQIGGQLQHPGIVPVYELGQFGDKRPYFTMKLVKGRTLAALLEERSEPIQDLPRFLAIFEQVCQTLGYAHARGVIHRDLKPSNIMVGAFGEVQVMDWGLAKVLTVGGVSDDHKEQSRSEEMTVIHTGRSGSTALESLAGSVMGTPAYMAPEQARGDVDLQDERCDVFGLGAILCKILTGQPPYQGATGQEVQRKAARCDIADALARLDDSGADEILLRLAKSCLAIELQARPRDGGVVAREMTAYLASVQERLRTAELAKVAAQTRAVEERKARKLTMALAVATLGLFVLGGGGWLWRAQANAAQRTEAVAALGEARLLQEQANAAPLSDRSKWTEALAAAKKAEGLASGGAVDQDTRKKIADLLKELEQSEQDRRMLATLEEIRLQKSAVKDNRFDSAAAAPLYAKAFQEYGIPLDSPAGHAQVQPALDQRA